MARYKLAIHVGPGDEIAHLVEIETRQPLALGSTLRADVVAMTPAEPFGRCEVSIRCDGLDLTGRVGSAPIVGDPEQNAPSPSDHYADADEAIDDARDAARFAVLDASDAAEAAIGAALAHLRAAAELMRSARKADAS